MKTSKNLVITLFALVIFGFYGCSNTIRMYGPEVVPTPNVDIPQFDETIALEIDKKVEDTIYETCSTLKYLEIYNWHEMLTTGFNNAFEGFNIVSLKDKPQLTLKILNATPTRTIGGVEHYETTLTTKYTIAGRSTLFSAQMAYSARLVDANGKILKRSTGTVKSKHSGTLKNDSWPMIQTLIESMYEKIAVDFFTTQ